MNKLVSATGIAIALVVTGCASSGAQQDVAQQFWDAMKSQDIKTAQSFAKTGTMNGVTVNKNAAVETISLQEARLENNKALVPTQLVGSRDGKREQVSFTTVLEQEDGTWKVNFDETMSSMLGLASPGVMGTTGKAQGEGMN